MLQKSAIWLIILVGACAPIKVKTVYDQKFEFNQFESFCWMAGCEFNIEGPSYLAGDTAVVQSFMNEIKKQLTRKGYRYDDETPDFLLNLHIVAYEKEVSGFTPYHIYGQENDFTPFMEETHYQYLEGSLIIDIANYQTSRVVWRSDVVGYMDDVSGFSKQTIKQVIRKALSQFPPD